MHSTAQVQAQGSKDPSTVLHQSKHQQKHSTHRSKHNTARIQAQSCRGPSAILHTLGTSMPKPGRCMHIFKGAPTRSPTHHGQSRFPQEQLQWDQRASGSLRHFQSSDYYKMCLQLLKQAHRRPRHRSYSLPGRRTPGINSA